MKRPGWLAEQGPTPGRPTEGMEQLDQQRLSERIGMQRGSTAVAAPLAPSEGTAPWRRALRNT